MVKQSTKPGNLAFKFVTFLDFGTAFSSATCYACTLPGRTSQLAVISYQGLELKCRFKADGDVSAAAE